MLPQGLETPRFALASSIVKGSIVCVGGLNGTEYLDTAETFDPREGRSALLSDIFKASLLVQDDPLQATAAEQRAALSYLLQMHLMSCRPETSCSVQVDDTAFAHVIEARQLCSVHSGGDESAGDRGLQWLGERGVLRSARPALRQMAAGSVHVSRARLWWRSCCQC